MNSSPSKMVPLRRSRTRENQQPQEQEQQNQKQQFQQDQDEEVEDVTSRVKAITSEENLDQILASHHSSSVLILHAPWAWPNFDPRFGFVRNSIEKMNSIQQEVEGEQQQQGGMTWTWLIENSKVPIFTVDVSLVPEAPQLLSISSKQLPLVCLMKGRSTVAQKPCLEYLDIASHSLLPPVTNRKELNSVLAEQGKAGKAAVIGYVGAAWCAPCCRIMPHLPQLAASYINDVHMVKMDFDAANQLVAQELSIEKIPTFVAFKTSPFCEGDNNNNSNNQSSSSSSSELPFGTLQHSDVARVSDAIGRWSDLACASSRTSAANKDMFTTDDF